jgi:hypothetical protein
VTGGTSLSAAAVVTSLTRMQVTVPAASTGVYAVQATTPGGTSALVNGDRYTVR